MTLGRPPLPNRTAKPGYRHREKLDLAFDSLREAMKVADRISDALGLDLDSDFTRIEDLTVTTAHAKKLAGDAAAHLIAALVALEHIPPAHRGTRLKSASNIRRKERSTPRIRPDGRPRRSTIRFENNRR